MVKRRKLSELFVDGKKVTITDPRDNDVHLWIQKINQFEHDQCQRKANAAKAQTLMIRNKDDQDDLRAQYGVRLGVDVERKDVINLIVTQDIAGLRPAKEDEVSSEEPWSEDDYLQGLLDEWEDGMREEYLADPKECRQVVKDTYHEMQKFHHEVEKRLEGEERGIRKDLELWEDQDLQREMVNRLIQLDADSAWIETYTKWRLIFAIRDIDDHDERMIEDLEEFNELQPQTIALLREEYNNLAVDLLEGKDWQGMPAS